MNLSWSLRLAQWPRPSRGQPVDAKRKPFPSLSHLSKGAVVLVRSPSLHLGEISPWKIDIDENQKKRIAIFRFGVISDFFARDYMERGERERLLRDKKRPAVANPFLQPHQAIALHHPGMGQTLPPRRQQNGVPLPYGQELSLRRELPTASVTILINEMMRRRLTSLDVILKASTVYRFLHQQGRMGEQVAPLSTAGAARRSCPTTFSRVTPCMGRCSWWVTNGTKPIS
ncbi:hypothetical protein DFAR_3460047 [Desulfarculales bacterium]